MKARSIAGLVIAVVLVAVLALPAMAVEHGETATVIVQEQEYVNFTITDYGSDGLNWGIMAPGTMDGEDDQTGAHGAVTLNVSAETNVNCTIQIRGTGNFSDGSGHSFALSNAEWDDDFNLSDAVAMTTVWDAIGSSAAGVEKIVNVWHTLSIPTGQYAATYNTTFLYSASALKS